MTPEQVLAVAKVYTDKAIEGAGGTAGKNCQIQSIEDIEGGSRITFAWYDGDDVLKTEYVDVMNGVDGQDGAPGQDGQNGQNGADGNDGVGISNIAFKETDASGNNVYTITLSNNMSYDFTAPRGPQGPTGIGLLNYSATEQSTGIKWIDGKVIYQKTIDLGALTDSTTIVDKTPVSIGASVAQYIDTRSLLVAPSIGWNGCNMQVNPQLDAILQIQCYNNSASATVKNKIGVSYKGGFSSITNLYVTVFYTKV